MIEVYVTLLDKRAKLPTYAHSGDAGADIYSLEEVIFEPGETKIVRTGLAVAIPEGYELQIRPRSGMSRKTPFRIANSPGTIDSGYRNEVGVIMQNTSNTALTIEAGQRIAQFVPAKVPKIEWRLHPDVRTIVADRGERGFGSSGL